MNFVANGSSLPHKNTTKISYNAGCEQWEVELVLKHGKNRLRL
jgi:hypothetical protein